MAGLEQDAALMRALIKYAGISAAEVARRAKVDAETVRRPATGKATTRISLSSLEKLQAAFPNFPGWQTSAAGEARLPYKQQDAVSKPWQAESDTVELEQIDLRYGMGGTFADGPVEVERRPFSREWLRSITATAPRHLFWAIGDGNSMEPTIRTGEIILIDRSQDTPRMDDGIWAVTHGEIGKVSRLRHLPDGTVELHSDNHLVRPQTAVDGELHVVGRVIAVVRKL
jgi:phage repressor protein C with HTH and peptisase S24 domain